MYVLCTFKIKAESQNLEHGCIMIPNPSQEPLQSSKATNQDLKEIYVLCTFKIKAESKYFEHGFIKYEGPYVYQDRDKKPNQEPLISSKAPMLT